MNKHHKVYYGSRVYSEDDIVDAPEPVVNEWAAAGRVRKLHVVRSKPVKAPEGIRPEPSPPQAKTKIVRGDGAA